MDDNLSSLRDLVIEEGELVYRLYWDSGGPGAGADVECVFRYQETYYAVLSYEDSPIPYDTLLDAINGYELYHLTESAEEIECPEMSAEELVKILQYFGDEAKVILINGESWMADVGGFARYVV